MTCPGLSPECLGNRGESLVPDSFTRSHNQCISVSEYRTFVDNTGQQVHNNTESFKLGAIGPCKNQDSFSFYELLLLPACCAILDEVPDLMTTSKYINLASLKNCLVLRIYSFKESVENMKHTA